MNKPKKLDFLVRVNNTNINTIIPREVLSCILVSLNQDLWHFMSYDTLLEYHNKAINVVIDFCNEAKKYDNESYIPHRSKYSAFIRTSNFLLKRIPDSREGLITRFWDLILSGEGVSNLNGFGFSNKYGDSFSGNAERISLTTLRKKEGMMSTTP